jgi:hypothetical protein
MKIAKVLGGILLALLALYGFGRFFVSQMGASRAPELAGVIAAAPADYAIEDRGELAPERAADVLLGSVRAHPPGSKVGIKFRHAGAEMYWLADTGADTLEERAAGAAGTRVQTIWRGHLADRLEWARTHGTPSAPGLPEPEKKNLYH